MMMMMNDDDDDDEKKMFSDFLVFFLEIKFRWKKFPVFWKIWETLFLPEKKSNFKFLNRRYFGEKNVPQISWNFGHN